MSEPFLGQIIIFGGSFAIRGYALCNGTATPIANNEALFNLLGTTYGGDGVTTFNLPDLRGRLPLHQGQGVGLTSRTIGESFGTETVTLATENLPSHTHQVFGSTEAATSTTGAGNVLATTATDQNTYTAGTTAPVSMAGAQVTPAGSSQPHNNLMPFLAVNFIVAMEGIYPPQN